jgi:hypothetical protein
MQLKIISKHIMSIRTTDPCKRPIPIGSTIRAVHSAHPAYRTGPDKRELKDYLRRSKGPMTALPRDAGFASDFIA